MRSIFFSALRPAAKTRATLTTLFLALTVATSLVALPIVNAVVNINYTHLYAAVSPQVVGVNQQVLLVCWTDNIPPDIGEQSGAVPSPTGRAGWDGVTLTVTKPDGSNETIALRRSDPVGSNWVLYTPSQVGTYYVQAFFPETWKNTTTTQSFYSAAVSNKAAFTVQQEKVPLYWPDTPLPNDYWTRPINSANHMWYQLAGSWLGGAYQQPVGAAGGTTTNFVYGKGPESAHILWTKPFYTGGLMEETFGSIGYQTTHYQGISLSAIIVNGRIHSTPRQTAHGSAGWEVIDLYTGETLYLNYSDIRPSFGQVYNYESPNQHGGFAYLWRTSGVTLPQIIQVPQAVPNNIDIRQLPNRTATVQTINLTATPVSLGTVWQMIDAYTGQTICYIANVTSGGTAVYGKDGSILRYNIVNLGTTAAPNYYLQVWNSSHGTMVSSQLGTGAWQWRPAGGTFGGANPYLGSLAYNYVHDGNDFFSLNVSVPSILGPRNPLLNETATIRAVREGEYVIVGTAGRNDERGIVPAWLMALSLKRGEEGVKLWETTFTPPFASYARNETVTMTGVYPEYGVVLYESAKLLLRWGYDMKTGKLLWTSVPENPFNYYGMSSNVYNGILYSFGYSGEIRAYNITTGNILWIYNATSVGIESAYGGNYPTGIAEICDGKLYLSNGEHSPTQPLMRGPNLRCIDATTGKEVWKILGYFGGMSPTTYNSIMADGILVGLNYFDMQLYAFGKGPSATTVSVPQTAIPKGSSVMITGTVTDQSPAGRRNINGGFDFVLKGTPAISDEDMEAWMEYLFMQQQKPTDAKGVPVKVQAVAPDGSVIDIGVATSDINGNYGLLWTPPATGVYKIVASFEGSKSYGPSSATAYLGVVAAPAASVAPSISPSPSVAPSATPSSPSPSVAPPTLEAPPVSLYVAAVVAVVAAVAVAAAVVLRRRRK